MDLVEAGCCAQTQRVAFVRLFLLQITICFGFESSKLMSVMWANILC